MWWQKAINDRKKEKMSIMIENFWDSVRRDERCKLYKNFMIYEKNIYLDENNDDVGQLNVIVIGVSPYNQMKVYARIESRDEGGEILRIDASELMQVLDCIDERFGEGAKNKATKKYYAGTSKFKIRVDDTYIKMTVDALLMMRNKRLLISEHISMLENANYKSQLYDYMNHFCNEVDEEIITRAVCGSRNIKKQHLINEMCMLSCQCFEISFALEIANNGTDWFIACVPLFFNAMSEL